MALSPRERSISIAVGVAALILAADTLALQPYLDQRASLVQQRNVARYALGQGTDMLDQQQRLEKRLAGMSASLGADASTAESRLLHLVHNWEQQAGMTNAAFGRVRSVEQRGLTRLTFEISATGPMAGVAMLIHRAQTAPIPLRIEDLRVSSNTDFGQDLRVDMDLSTLCESTAGHGIAGGSGSGGAGTTGGMAAANGTGG